MNIPSPLRRYHLQRANKHTCILIFTHIYTYMYLCIPSPLRRYQLCMYIHTCIYPYIYICIYIQIYVHTRIYTYQALYNDTLCNVIHTYNRISTYVCNRICIYVYTYRYVYIHYIHMYIHTKPSARLPFATLYIHITVYLHVYMPVSLHCIYIQICVHTVHTWVYTYQTLCNVTLCDVIHTYNCISTRVYTRISTYICTHTQIHVHIIHTCTYTYQALCNVTLCDVRNTYNRKSTYIYTLISAFVYTYQALCSVIHTYTCISTYVYTCKYMYIPSPLRRYQLLFLLGPWGAPQRPVHVYKHRYIDLSEICKRALFFRKKAIISFWIMIGAGRCCSVSQVVAVRWECGVLCYSVLQCAAVCPCPQCVAVCYSVMRCCSVIQCVAVWCSMLQSTAVCWGCVVVRCSTLLQRATVCHGVLQCVAQATYM